MDIHNDQVIMESIVNPALSRSDAQVQHDRAKRKLAQAQLIVTDICGQARNAYSKRSLKKDFQDGLAEMEETAAYVELDARGAVLSVQH